MLYNIAAGLYVVYMGSVKEEIRVISMCLSWISGCVSDVYNREYVASNVFLNMTQLLPHIQPVPKTKTKMHFSKVKIFTN